MVQEAYEVNQGLVELASGSVRPKKGPDPALNQEVGVSNVLPIGAWLSWLSDGTSDGATIINTDPVSVDGLTEMLKRDGHARALYRLMTLPILSALKDAKWIAPPNEKGGDEETAFANLMFTLPPSMGGMSTPLSKIVRQTLRAVALGYSPFEEVRYVPDDGPLAGKIALKKLAYREPRTIRFRVDQDGGYNGLRQLTQIMGKPVDVNIDADKTWYFSVQEEENPFYGVSMFEAAYQHYTIKKKLYYIAHLAAQFAAVPGRIGEYPANIDNTTLQQFKQNLSNFAFNTSMTVPTGYKVTPFNSNGGFQFLPLIEHHNLMMSESVLAKFMDQEDRQVLIDNSKADAAADMFIMMLESIMAQIAESWTYYLMPKYIDWNFGTGIYPVFQFGKLTDEQREAVQTVFMTALAAPNDEAGGNMSPEFYRQLEMSMSTSLGLDVDYDEVEKREEQQAQEQEQQQMQQAQQAQTALNTPPQAGPGFGPPSHGQPGGNVQPGQGSSPTDGGQNTGAAPQAGFSPQGAGSSAQATMSGGVIGGGYISLSEVAEELERRLAGNDDADPDED